LRYLFWFGGAGCLGGFLAVSQITDGQVQAGTSTASATPARYTGAANREVAGGFAFMAGVVGAIAML